MVVSEATLEGILTQLCPWCKDTVVLCPMTGPNSTSARLMTEGGEFDNLSLLTRRQQLPRVGRDANSLGVALLAVILELPDGMPIYHAGTDDNLELWSLQEHSAECFWQGLLILEATPVHSQRHPTQRLSAESRECHLQALLHPHSGRGLFALHIPYLLW